MDAGVEWTDHMEREEPSKEGIGGDTDETKGYLKSGMET